MHKIQFVKKYSDCILPTILPNTYVIYHKEKPKIDIDIGSFSFAEYKEIYSNLKTEMLIFFDLNRIINPSNRCDFVFEFLFNLSSDIPKISIDSSPFIGEPWRLWFHYGLCQCGDFGIPYSYAIETEWKHWFYRDKANSVFDSDSLGMCIKNTYSNLDNLEYGAKFIQCSADDLDWYDEAKKFVFDKYNTPKLIINNLLKEANKRYGLKYDYEAYLDNNPYELLDLPVYRFIDEENKRRLRIYNKIVQMGQYETIQ
jgi:hypothetical protein